MRAPLVLVLLAAACGSYREAASLDAADTAELASLRARLADTAIAVVPRPPHELDAECLSRALSGAGLSVATPPTAAALATVVVEEARSEAADPGFLTNLTLDLLPSVNSRSYSWRLRVACGGRETSVGVEDSAPCVHGLFGWVFGRLAGWRIYVLYGPPPLRPDDRLALAVARSVAATLDAK